MLRSEFRVARATPYRRRGVYILALRDEGYASDARHRGPRLALRRHGQVQAQLAAEALDLRLIASRSCVATFSI